MKKEDIWNNLCKISVVLFSTSENSMPEPCHGCDLINNATLFEEVANTIIMIYHITLT